MEDLRAQTGGRNGVSRIIRTIEVADQFRHKSEIIIASSMAMTASWRDIILTSSKILI